MRKKETPALRSHCPVSYTLDFIGDKWSLLIIRDLLLNGKKYYGEFLEAEEGIATNILSDRLEKLEHMGLLEWEKDPAHGSKVIYRLTPKGLDLLPMLLEMILWASKHDTQTAANPEIVRRIKKDREAFIQEVIKNAGK